MRQKIESNYSYNYTDEEPTKPKRILRFGNGNSSCPRTGNNMTSQAQRLENYERLLKSTNPQDNNKNWDIPKLSFSYIKKRSQIVNDCEKQNFVIEPAKKELFGAPLNPQDHSLKYVWNFNFCGR